MITQVKKIDWGSIFLAPNDTGKDVSESNLLRRHFKSAISISVVDFNTTDIVPPS